MFLELLTNEEISWMVLLSEAVLTVLFLWWNVMVLSNLFSVSHSCYI